MAALTREFRACAARGARFALVGTAAVCALLATPVAAQEQEDDTDTTTVDEVLVTGTSIRGEQPVGSNLVSVGRDEIISIGAPTTSELLAKVPQLDSFNNTPRPGLGGAVGVATSPGLRNLPVNATLVLMDGHRLVGDSPLQSRPDPSSIPPAAVERIEVVPDGSSAIYGSDAVAGVINIITRRNLNGAETSLRYGWAEHGYEAMDLSQAIGKTWDGGSAMIVVAYNENENLNSSDLPFYTDDLTPFGGIDLRPTNCFPPNIRIGTTTYAPPGYAPGPPGRCSPGALSDVIPSMHRTSIVGNFRHEITSALTVWSDLKYSATYLSSQGAPGNANLTINSTNPFFRAPPGTGATSETVLYNVLPLTGPPVTTASTKAGNFIAGADYELPRDWRISASIDYGWSESIAVQPTFDAGRLAAAAAGTTTQTALDPFGTGTNPAVAAGIADFESVFGSDQKLYDYLLKADGRLFTLPGGDMKAAVGVAYRTTSYDATNSVGAHGANQNFASISAERTVTAVFGEVFIPLVGENNGIPLVHSLDVSVAARYDNYNDFGETTNPKIGFRWSPIEDLMFRGSYGTSFHAPDMGDSYAIDTRALFFANFPIVPPGAPPVDTIVLAGGNTGLQPEEATTYSLGLEYNPSWLPGFGASLTYYKIDFVNQIRTPPISPEVFTNPAFQQFTVLNPTRAQLDEIAANFRLIGVTAPIPLVGQIIDLRRQNLSSTRTDGFDFDVRYRWDWGQGNWLAQLSGSKVDTFEIQSAAGAPFTPQNNFVKLRVRGYLAWTQGPFSADAAVNYSGGFETAYTIPAGTTAIWEVDPFVTVDLHAAYELPFEGHLGSTTLSINVLNALGEEPPVNLVGGGYSSFASPLGRTVWVGVVKKW